MKTYKIEVFTQTKKGHKEIHYTVIVNSKNTLKELDKAYRNKYIGFCVLVEEVQTVEIEEIKNPEVSIKPVVSNVEFMEKNYSTYSCEPDRYKALISTEDIKGYNEFKTRLDKINKDKSELEKDFKEHIENTFSIEELKDFSWNNGYVEFTFYTSKFKFN